jgi:predicted Rossmann fold nucleotide-binding protein DprA/Smf involved in DNA uptake
LVAPDPADNIVPRTFCDLVNHYGGARAALAALPALARRGGASAPARICSREDAQAELKAARTRGVEFVALGEPDYPPRLRVIDDAPPLLAVRGHDRIYPAEHRDLLDAILAEGAAVPKMPLAWGPRAEGTSGLLKQGATLVNEAADVIAVLVPILGRAWEFPVEETALEVPGPTDAEPAEDERARITGLLGPTPVSLDDLVRPSHASPVIGRPVLLELEIAGRMERRGGSLVSLL